MMVTMVLLLLVMKMREPRKDLVLLEAILPLEEANIIMQVETVQADTVQQVIRYLLEKTIQFSIIVHRGGRRI